jgi:hypothetical protein
MDTAWIPIFVLTVTECVAPTGKTVCQEQHFELQFVTESDCEYALEQLVTLKDASQSVIVDKSKSNCAPSARRHHVFASLSEVAESVDNKQGWRAPDVQEPTPEATRKLHQARLESLMTCEESKGVAPCKIGEIIVEDAVDEDPVEVWRRSQ